MSPNIPELWEIVNLGELGKWSSGGTPSRSHSEYYGGDIPWVKTGNLPDGLIVEIDEHITQEGLKNSSAKLFPSNSLIVAMYGATIGKLGILNNSAATNQACAALIAQNITKELIPYLFNYLLFSREDLRKIVKGGAQPNISQTVIKDYLCPLPPLKEQKRIVTKIEALQTRSTAVKEELEAIKPLLNQFRKSVLASAFRGDLTKDWRSQNKHIPWEHTTLESVIQDRPRNGYSPKAVDYPTRVKSFSLSATTSGVFKPEYFKYLDKEIEQDSYLWLKPGDVLIQRSNTLEYVGTSAIYTGQFGDFVYPDTVMKIQVNQDKTTNKFVHCSLSNKKTRQYFKDNATGTAGNMPKINQKIVMNTPISLPSIEEQKEIVRRIESLFKLADNIEQQYQQTEIDLETLNQSILAKAFRGELVPQDANDEPASVLLERIKEERKNQITTKKSKTKTKTKKKRSSKKKDEQLGIPGI